MSAIVYLCSFSLLCAGLFFLLCTAFGAPEARSVKAMRAVLYRKEADEAQSFENSLDKLAIPLSEILPFPKDSLEKLRRTLESADIATPPAVYVTRSILKAAMLFSVALMASLVLKPMIVAAFAMPLLVAVSEMQKADKITAQYRQRVERDLPDFVATISTELTASRDIIRIMKSFLPTAGKALRRELEITIADMETGSYELALTRLGSRVNSPILNNVVRGLTGVVRGNNQIAYFQMLGFQLKEMEINRMKKQAQKCLPKISACAMILLGSILMLFMGVLLDDMMTGAGALF